MRISLSRRSGYAGGGGGRHARVRAGGLRGLSAPVRHARQAAAASAGRAPASGRVDGGEEASMK